MSIRQRLLNAISFGKPAPAIRPAALLQQPAASSTATYLLLDDAAPHLQRMLLSSMQRQFPESAIQILALKILAPETGLSSLEQLLTHHRQQKNTAVRLIPVKPIYTEPGHINRFQLGQPVIFQLSAEITQTTVSPNLERGYQNLQDHFANLNKYHPLPDSNTNAGIIHAVLKLEPVRIQLLQRAKLQQCSPKQMEQQAEATLLGIAARPNSSTVRCFTPLLNWVWQRLAKQIDITGMEHLLALPQDVQRIYIPCHRSHLDYLLLNWVLHKNGFKLPFVAAGDNLNIPVIGHLLQQAGAVFMRRQFQGDDLYSSLFQGYLNELTESQLPFEFFIEGGRSRTGHLLPARLGLLSMLLSNQLRRPHQRMALIPVWFGYEQIPEVPAYISQLQGEKKQPETLRGVLKSAKLLKRNLGNIQVAFAPPIRVSPPESKQLTRHKAGLLATEVLTRINQLTQFNEGSLLALVLLDQPQQTKQQVIARFSALNQLVQHLPDNGSPHPLFNATEAIRNADARGQLSVNQQHVTIDHKQSTELWYLRNTVEHCLLLPALYLLLCQRLERPHALCINRLMRLTYPLLKAEYYLPWTEQQLTTLLHKQRQHLLDQGLLAAAKHQHWRCTAHPLVALLQRLAEGVVLRYLLVLKSVSAATYIDRETLLESCQTLGLQLQRNTGHPVAPYADRRALEHLINLLLRFDLLEEQPPGIRLGTLPRDLPKHMSQLLPAHLMQSLESRVGLRD
ncbi:1-acyl-sn-glycerol-3-phosphate acyltransferase [Pontibacter sp. JAM-7]|uniref:1-acyl-sn-glycerol-3-phosphate acyltransferase n=1 Tax=Pontibacter sp. JAM-7 TaxID=3366581 RepID=UPI003AF666A8